MSCLLLRINVTTSRYAFLKAPDFCCLGVVYILQSFQIRKAVMLNIEHPQRL